MSRTATTHPGLRAVLDRLGGVKASGKGYVARCPAHEDRRPSLSLAVGREGGVLVRCHAGCTMKAIVAAIGLEIADLAPPGRRRNGREQGRRREWPAFHAVSGEEVSTHVREDRVDGKRTWWQPNFPSGVHTADLALYRGDILSQDPQRAAVVCEGEPATDALVSIEDTLGVVALGTVTGADGIPGDDALWVLVGRRVVLWPDQDEPGHEHVRRIAGRLAALGVEDLRVVIPPADAPPGWDGADATPDERRELVEAAVPWEPPRAEDGAALLDDVAAFVRRYVVLSDAQRDATALWVAHTHAISAADATPYLRLRSAEKASGKTRLLEVVELVVRAPLFTGNVSAAALARVLHNGRTLLLDEVDSVFRPDGRQGEQADLLRGVLDSGWRRGGPYVRLQRGGGEGGMVVVEFATFGAKALAGIGRLPGTLEDRSIPIELRRRRRDEEVDRFRRRRVLPVAETLRKRLAEWAAAHIDALRGWDGSIPDALPDRQADSWEPLLAIAHEAGGDWPQRARSAATELSGTREVEEDSAGVLLLSDMREVFGDNERLASSTILERLHGLEERPWRTWGRRGEGLNAHGLARLLRPFGIRSQHLRVGGATAMAYESGAFEDAWARYLSSPASGSAHLHVPHDDAAEGVQETHEKAASESNVAQSPSRDGHERAGVQDVNGGIEAQRHWGEV